MKNVKTKIRRISLCLMTLLVVLSCVACNPSETPGTTGASTTTMLLPNTTGTSLPTTDATTTAPATTEAVTTTAAPEEIILPPEIKNVILIIGDGMGLEHIAAAEMAYGSEFTFTSWQFANVKTNSYNDVGSAVETTDSAASATALATGIMTNNGYVGKNRLGKDLTTVMDVAKRNGKATGIVTTDYLHGATPAGFSAHASNREDAVTILATQAQSGVDFLCGAQDSYAMQARSAYEAEGYHFVDDWKQVRYSTEYEKVCCAVQLEGHTTDARLTLRSATLSALSFLEKDEDGFVLMIEQAHVDKYSHSNDFEGAIKSVQSLANTVDGILQWMDDREDTVILITADHETGGLNASGKETLPNRYNKNGHEVFYQWTTGSHTNSNVGLFVYGATVEFKEHSYYHSNYMVKNTDIIDIMKQWIVKDKG